MALVLLFTALTFAPAQKAEAFHVGAYLGPSLFTGPLFGTSTSTSYLTGGFDVAMGMIPAFEFGAYYYKTLSYYQTMIGLEANFYPMLSHIFYVGGKLGNANLVSDNHIVYAPVVGFNYDIAPTLSAGVDATYFIFNSSGLRDINLLANIKFWL